MMRQVKTLGLLGTGVIGGGWAARALHFGIDVLAADVKPEMESWIRGAVENAEGALSRLTFAPLPPKGKLHFTNDLNAMAGKVDFIQENIPAKVKLFETKDGEETVPVEMDLTDDQRKAIYAKVDKKIRSASTFQLYKKGDLKQLADIAKREAEAEIWNEQRQAGLQKIAETFLKRGDEKGYKRGSVGAKNPFPLVQDNKKMDGADKGSAQQQVMDSLQGKK